MSATVQGCQKGIGELWGREVGHSCSPPVVVRACLAWWDDWSFLVHGSFGSYCWTRLNWLRLPGVAAGLHHISLQPPQLMQLSLCRPTHFFVAALCSYLGHLCLTTHYSWLLKATGSARIVVTKRCSLTLQLHHFMREILFPIVVVSQRSSVPCSFCSILVFTSRHSR